MNSWYCTWTILLLTYLIINLNIIQMLSKYVHSEVLTWEFLETEEHKSTNIFGDWSINEGTDRQRGGAP